MKKILLLLSVSAVCMNMAAQTAASNAAATFENITVDSLGLYRSDNPTTNGAQTWVSGDYTFTTYVDGSYAPSYYYYDVAVSSKTETTFVADYSAGFDMKSAAGGAAEGNNFAVWYSSWYGNAKVTMAHKAAVSGMYVCNNTYAQSSMLNGDSYAKKFADGDWFKLTVTGYTKSGDDYTAGSTADFYLADYRDGKTILVDQWTWFDLTSLGEVDAIGFSLSSTDNGTYGMNTPAYFCFDNLGGTAPSTTSVNGVGAGTDVPTRKMLIDGKVVIRRGEQIYNILGQKIR